MQQHEQAEVSIKKLSGIRRRKTSNTWVKTQEVEYLLSPSRWTVESTSNTSKSVPETTLPNLLKTRQGRHGLASSARSTTGKRTLMTDIRGESCSSAVAMAQS